MQVDGSGLVDLSADLSNDGQPTWSPDGKKLAFTSSRDLNGEIYVMNADGSDQRRVTFSKLINDTAPVWSPDGRRLAFMCTDAKPVTQICVADADGSDPRTLTRGSADNLYPVWSPDGASVLYVSARPATGGQYAIYSVASAAEASACSRPTPVAMASRPSRPTARRSPTSAAAHRCETSTASTRWRANGSGQHRVAAPPGRIDGPQWSPDGRKLVFMAIGPPPRSRADLYVEHRDGSGRVELTAGPGDSAGPVSVETGRRDRLRAARGQPRGHRRDRGRRQGRADPYLRSRQERRPGLAAVSAAGRRATLADVASPAGRTIG